MVTHDCEEIELFSISAAACVVHSDEMDTASDRSTWVRQYNDWQDATHPRSRVGRAHMLAGIERLPKSEPFTRRDLLVPVPG